MNAGPTTEPHRRAACYALLSLLLRYPEPELLDARDVVLAAAADLPDAAQRGAVGRFLAYWSGASPATIARDYVATFDLQKGCGLYLSHYLFGDRRQRGMTFVRLKSLYEAAGWELTSRELPDYLPLMLEFAARAPEGYGETVLREFRASLELLRLGLREHGSPYVHLLDAVVAGLPGMTRDEQDAVSHLAAEGPPDELVGLELLAPRDAVPVAGGAATSSVGSAWPAGGGADVPCQVGVSAAADRATSDAGDEGAGR